MVLIIYKDMEFFCNMNADFAFIKENIKGIYSANNVMSAYFNKAKGVGIEKAEKPYLFLEEVKKKIGAVGFPFDDFSARFYIDEKELKYTVLDMNEYNEKLGVETNYSSKKRWVKQAKKNGLSLQDWVNFTLSMAVENDL